MLEVIRDLAHDGVTVVVIEHTMRAMMRLVDRFVVLNQGTVLAEGAPHVVTEDENVIEAYLGAKWMALRAQA
jgi:branched-chain amino acid transport system permease protein